MASTCGSAHTANRETHCAGGDRPVSAYFLGHNRPFESIETIFQICLEPRFFAGFQELSEDFRLFV